MALRLISALCGALLACRIRSIGMAGVQALAHGRGARWLTYGALTAVLYLLCGFLGPHPNREKTRRSATMSNLKQIGIALRNYSDDHGGALPVMRDRDAARTALAPYTRFGEKDPSYWRSASDRGPFLVNTRLSGLRSGRNREALSRVPFAWAADPWGPQGRRGVCFADGTARYVTSAEWEELWRGRPGGLTPAANAARIRP